jgi:hypothetical protein
VKEVFHPSLDAFGRLKHDGTAPGGYGSTTGKECDAEINNP